MDMAAIKAAIRKHHGGWDGEGERGRTDQEFLQLWGMLDEATRAGYLASLTPLPDTPAPPITTPAP